MLQARTKEQKDEVLKRLGFEEEGVCCHFPLNFGEVGDLGYGFKSYKDRLYIDGDITFDQMAAVVDYLRKQECSEETNKHTEWSEVDLGMFDALIEEYETRAYNADENSIIVDDLWYRAKWLKSIKDKGQNHWKPTKEQIMALRWIMNHLPYCTHKEEISELHEQLMKIYESWQEQTEMRRSINELNYQFLNMAKAKQVMQRMYPNHYDTRLSDKTNRLRFLQRVKQDGRYEELDKLIP